MVEDAGVEIAVVGVPKGISPAKSRFGVGVGPRRTQEKKNETPNERVKNDTPATSFALRTELGISGSLNVGGEMGKKSVTLQRIIYLNALLPDMDTIVVSLTLGIIFCIRGVEERPLAFESTNTI